MLGQADDNAIEGATDPDEVYDLLVTRTKDRWTFSFRDGKGHSGTLTLALPKTISIFEVDPRRGSALYKERKLTANAAGDGLFRATSGANQKITPVLHGRRNACTSAEQFTHWTLLLHGPADTNTLCGTLDSAAQ